MGLRGDFIQESLLTRRIILKSKSIFPRPFFLPLQLTAARILLASIRNRGNCLCPRCLVPMSRLQNLGMKLDMKQRASLARIDDDARRRKVQIARRIIYEQNYAVNSEGVEKVLKEESLVPTLVRTEFGANRTLFIDRVLTECFLESPKSFRIRPLPNVRRRPHA